MVCGYSTPVMKLNPAPRSVDWASESVLSVTEIDQCLPQTQCSRCGYPTCLDYATAIADKETQINRCPPGGATTLAALAACIGQSALPLASDLEPYLGRTVASIDESQCIGCTLCLDPCPVDAILGASKQMHTVLAAECSGCELCISVCPVDCIEMIAPTVQGAGETWPQFKDEEVARWRERSAHHQIRLATDSERDSTMLGSEAIKQQIRSAVNRERTRRWRKSNRATAQLKNRNIVA